MTRKTILVVATILVVTVAHGQEPSRSTGSLNPAQLPQSDSGRDEARGTPDREEKILKHIEQRAYRDAIREIAAWELEIARARPPAVFESGHFRSEALHLAFRVPGEWERFDPSEVDAFAQLRALGFSIELILKDKGSEALFIFMTNDSQRIAQALGAEPAKVYTDEMLLNQAITSAKQVSGTLSSHELVTLKQGERALVAKILGPAEQFVLNLVLLPDGNRQHLMMLISTAVEQGVSEDRLRQILGTIELGYGASQPAAIVKYLRCLLAGGEDELASSELARARKLIAAQIPGPRVDGNTVRWAAYGISLENPDPEVWRLDIQQEPLGSAIFLADGQSDEEGLGIMVIDVLAMAPAIASQLEEPPADTRILAETAMRIAQEAGVEIEEQEFTSLHGRLAYQVTLGPLVGGLRARYLLQSRADYVVGFLFLAKIERFEQQVDRYERILRGTWVQLGR